MLLDQLKLFPRKRINLTLQIQAQPIGPPYLSLLHGGCRRIRWRRRRRVLGLAGTTDTVHSIFELINDRRKGFIGVLRDAISGGLDVIVEGGVCCIRGGLELVDDLVLKAGKKNREVSQRLRQSEVTGSTQELGNAENFCKRARQSATVTVSCACTRQPKIYR